MSGSAQQILIQSSAEQVGGGAHTCPTRHTNLRFERTRPLWALLAFFILSCGPAEGNIELHWVFVDQNLQRIFPLGSVANSCAMDRWLTNGEPSSTGDHLEARVAVRVRLLGYDCADTANLGTGEAHPCPNGEPLIDERFSCEDAHAIVPRIPALDDAIVWVTQIEVDDGSGAAFVAADRCISTPGPRQRKIVAGSITDLELYQFVVHAVSDEPLALEDCN